MNLGSKEMFIVLSLLTKTVKTGVFGVAPSDTASVVLGRLSSTGLLSFSSPMVTATVHSPILHEKRKT